MDGNDEERGAGALDVEGESQSSCQPSSYPRVNATCVPSGEKTGRWPPTSATGSTVWLTVGDG